MSAITAKASRKMKKYAVLTREPRCFLGSFDFSWEQRKVQDVADRFDNLRIPVAANLRVHGTTPYYGANGIQDYVEGFTHDGEFVLVAEDGANDLKNYPVKCVNGRIWVNNHAHVLQGKAGISDNSFLAFAISQSDIESLLVGGSRAKLNAETLMSIEFKLPCLQEQYRIGEYLTQLDNLITLHQRECISFTARAGRFILTANKKRNTSSWEQRKLEDIASDMVAGGDIDKDLILAEGQYPVIANALTGDGIVGYYDKEYRVNAPAVTVTGRGDVGHAKARLVNFTPVVRLLSVKSEHDVFFLENAINTLKIVIESTGVPQLTVPQLAKYEVAFPRQLDEEEHIGAFFKQLDHLITLHQRKCVFLFGFFQAFISMIFTASTFSWEQRKLGELVDRVVRKNTNNESTLPLTISAQYGLVDQITYFNNRVASRDVSNYYLVLNGEFAYNKSTSDGYPFGAVKRLDLYEKGVLSTLYIVFAPKKEQQIDSDYLTVFFDTDRWHKGVAERAAEGARNHGLLNISAEDFFDIDLSVPKDIVEQKQIGAFIRQLDNLITLHQRELEKLQNIKKSMLEKMFV